MNIGPKTIERAGEMVNAMLRMHRETIDKAFLRADDALNIALGVKFKPGEAADQIEIDVSIKFVTDQVKDSATALFNEHQGELFPEKDKK